MAKKKTSKNKKSKKKSWRFNLKNIAYLLWGLLICGTLFAFATIVIISFSKMPDTQELENPKFEQSTIVLSDNGQELGRIFKKNREFTSYESLSPHVVNALIATEDERFFDHSGIDFKGTLRAIAFVGGRGGASTITQQLAKQFFTKRSRNIVRRIFQKLKEWVIAIEFEKRYTKEEIMAMLLNKYDYLNDSNGIAAAAKTYFGKDQKSLRVEEAAVLIGMLKNPRIYNPINYPENAMKRREVVLSQMRKVGYLTQVEYDSLRQLPIDVSNFDRVTHTKGPAPYFMGELKKWVRNLLNEDRYTKPGGGKYDLYQDGLKIHTTINLDMQNHAENAMHKHMRNVQDRYFAEWKNKDPWTYDADARQQNIRKNSLKQMIEESDRYRRLRSRHLVKIGAELSQNIDNVRLWDSDIKRMIEEKKSPGYLKKLTKEKIASSKQVATYEEIMSSNLWPKLESKWYDLQDDAKKAFNRKVKMQVFDHSITGHREAVMTPLDSLKYHRMHLQLGSISMEPKTGYIKTWVGGIGYKYFKYDHIRSNRLVGSTFKPFVYTTFIKQGHSPCWKIKDVPYIIEKNDPNFNLSKTWAPQNARNRYSGQELTLYECLEKSLNTASVWLMKQIGSVAAVKNLAVNMGIPAKKIPDYPSICLGTPELSVMDLTSAYNAFANNGTYSDPIFVTRIEDKNGRVIYNDDSKQRKVLESNYNYVMVDMLTKNMRNHQGKLKTTFGGKTGTTNDHVDGWFMGITPNLAVGTWVGGEKSWIRHLSLDNGQGGRMARPFFVEFIKNVENDPNIEWDSSASFQKPQGDLGIVIDCNAYENLYRTNEQQTPSSAPQENEFDDAEFDDF